KKLIYNELLDFIYTKTDFCLIVKVSKLKMEDFRMKKLVLSAIITGLFGITFCGEMRSDANTVALYHFNENSTVIADSGPYNLNGTRYSGLITTGLFGNAFNPYGSSDYITVANTNGAFSFNADQSFTLEIWFQLTSATGSYPRYLIAHSYEGLNGGPGYNLILNTSEQLEFVVRDTTDTVEVKSQVNAVSTGKWYYAAAVYNYTANKLELYLNGILAGSAAISTALQGNLGGLTAPLYFSATGSYYYWYGLIDDTRISNKARTAQEIAAYWNENKLLVNGPEIIPVASPTNNPKPAFKWHPVPTATAYTFQVSSTGSFSNPLISVPTADTFYIPIMDLPVGQIYWRVASDVAPNLFSDIGNFTLQDKNIPILIPVEPNPTTSHKPAFNWYKVEGAAAYQLMINNTSNFSSVLVSTPLADTTFIPALDLPSGIIYWKVKSDLSVTFSNVESFIIQNDSTPILYGFKGDTVSGTKPSFRWKPVTGAAAYTIQINTTTSFTSPYISTPVADTLYIPLIGLQQNVKYFWRVNSDILPGQYSPVDSLVIDTLRVVQIKRPSFANRIVSISTFPNPAVPQTTISYSTGKTGKGILKIFNTHGKLVFYTKVHGSGTLNWKADALSSGTYVTFLTAGNKTISNKLVLIK
ncbi:MAG: LamG-like jellyroll fold domain-containing protein, partial [bacterium]